MTKELPTQPIIRTTRAIDFRLRATDAATLSTLLSVLVFLGGSANGQTATHISDRQLDDVYVEALDLDIAISQLAYEKAIPIGLEVDPARKRDRKPVSLRLERVTVGEVVDKLLAIDPGYQWREVGKNRDR